MNQKPLDKWITRLALNKKPVSQKEKQELLTFLRQCRVIMVGLRYSIKVRRWLNKDTEDIDQLVD